MINFDRGSFQLIPLHIPFFSFFSLKVTFVLILKTIWRPFFYYPAFFKNII